MYLVVTRGKELIPISNEFTTFTLITSHEALADPGGGGAPGARAPPPDPKF